MKTIFSQYRLSIQIIIIMVLGSSPLLIGLMITTHLISEKTNQIASQKAVVDEHKTMIQEIIRSFNVGNSEIKNSFFITDPGRITDVETHYMNYQKTSLIRNSMLDAMLIGCNTEAFKASKHGLVNYYWHLSGWNKKVVQCEPLNYDLQRYMIKVNELFYQMDELSTDLYHEHLSNLSNQILYNNTSQNISLNQEKIKELTRISTEIVNVSFTIVKEYQDGISKQISSMISLQKRANGVIVKIGIFFVLLGLFLGIRLIYATLIRPMNELVSHSKSLDIEKLTNPVRLNLSGELRVISDTMDKIQMTFYSHYQALEKEVAERTQTLQDQAYFFQKNPGPIFRVNANCQVLYCNPSSVDIIGTLQEEEQLDTIFPELKDINFHSLIRRNEVKTIETTFNDRHYQLSLCGISNLEACNVYSTDITPLKLTERELIQASAAKTRFLSQMSHEFRTPLNAILGLSQAMMVEKDLKSDERQQFLEKIKHAADKVLLQVAQIIEFSNIENGSIELKIKPVDLRLAIQDAINSSESLSQERHIRIVNDVSGTTGLFVLADEQRLKEIFNNLISNAIKFNKEGGSVTIRVTQSDELYLKIHVIDTGIGIDDKNKSLIFESFTRCEDFHNVVEGVGVGLSITKRLVELMGGDIEVASTKGEGSTFSFSLKQVQSLGTTSQSQEISLEEKSIKVVYIEDNPTNAMVMKSLLKCRPSIDLKVCVNGKEALAYLSTHVPHLVLLDLHLPDYFGLDLMKDILLLPGQATTPFIAVSADALESQIQAALDAGCKNYITKPVIFKEVISLLDEFISNHVQLNKVSHK